VAEDKETEAMHFAPTIAVAEERREDTTRRWPRLRWPPRRAAAVTD